MAQNFGDQLRRERSRLSLSQEKLAELAGYDKAHISNLERGKKQPSADGIDRLARALNIPPLTLVADTDVAGKYAAQRLDPQDRTIQQRAERRRHSQKIVALHEIYKRIMELHSFFLAGTVLNSPDALSEAYIHHLDDLLREACTEAAQVPGMIDLAVELYVPDSLDPRKYTDGFTFFEEEQECEQINVFKSEAAVLKWVLRYPEADSAPDRDELAAKLNLNRIDQHLEKLRSEFHAQERENHEAIRHVIEDEL
jgi:transcriptional regulator with XRE-family HTH domain